MATRVRDSAQMARENGEHVVDYLCRRGYVSDISDEAGLRRAFDSGVLTAYVGFDPTASSLHVGHQLGIMALAVLQRFGYQPIALGGGGTALVGDPTGKTSTRDVLSEESIRQNLQSILPQFDRLLDFKGNRFAENPPALLMNNADWLLRLNYIEFLRDIGRHFSVNEMLAAETYKVRVEAGAGLELCGVQLPHRAGLRFPASFQTRQDAGCKWAAPTNGETSSRASTLSGVLQVRRRMDWSGRCSRQRRVEKMGKTAGNSLWLDPQLTSPFEYYQYWINVDDSEVQRLLNLYTFVPDDEITSLTAVEGDALRNAKRVLAFEVTRLAHGARAAEEAESAARALFAGHSVEEMLAESERTNRSPSG